MASIVGTGNVRGGQEIDSKGQGQIDYHRLPAGSQGKRKGKTPLQKGKRRPYPPERVFLQALRSLGPHGL